MKNQKIFYIFKDPMGADESKVGITGHPAVRLGTYQNSYSRKSHIACFDTVYIGSVRDIGSLERAVKQKFDWQIERDGRGASEWVSMPYDEIEREVDNIIAGYRFKVRKARKSLLPLTVDNLQKFEDYYTEKDENDGQD